MAHLRDLKLLKELDLCDTNVADEGLSRLKDLTRLESLDIRGTEVSGAGRRTSKGSSNCAP